MSRIVNACQKMTTKNWKDADYQENTIKSREKIVEFFIIIYMSINYRHNSIDQMTLIFKTISINISTIL